MQETRDATIAIKTSKGFIELVIHVESQYLTDNLFKILIFSSQTIEI